ncbi:sugar ABC transporter ATP-binding protein [Streptomyces sp. NPDC087856]|uniref:sugar ABC transporter ATP-binding protein n=1 Tax=Streptomyces sp. NPDC087856 TaxID=3365811 RepID=UPI00381EE157
MTSPAPLPLLSVRGLSKSFPGHRALSGVDIDVHGGEIVAVVGQNGSGKSTLVKVLTGIHDPDHGSTITVRGQDGEEVPAHTARTEIHVIHQDLGLIPMLSTVENLGLGRGPQGRAFLPTHTRREQQQARALIARFGADFDVRARVETLTAAERTIVAIARALHSGERPPQILLLDEPTAALHGNEADQLFAAVRRVAAEGTAVVFISHRLDEVLGLAHRVVALRGGRVVADVPTTDLDRTGLIELIAGRVLDEISVLEGRRTGNTVLSLRNVSGVGVTGVDLDLRAGEILGVCGILGSGREQLASLVFGAKPRTAGEVQVLGKPVHPSSPRHAIQAGIGFVPADRHTDGAVMSMRARENLTLPGLAPLRGRFGNLSKRAERRTALHWAARVELEPPQPERDLELFSGGNQQKVLLAKWLRNKPKVLLLDEPTQGVDVGAKAAIYQLLSDAAAEGTGVLVSSSDTEELAVLCDRVLVFRNGLLAARLDRPHISESRLVAESLSTRTEAAASTSLPVPDTAERGSHDGS